MRSASAWVLLAAFFTIAGDTNAVAMTFRGDRPRSDQKSLDSGPELATSPMLVLGASRSGLNDAFGKVAGAWRLGNGDIIVGDARIYQLKLFDQTGHFLRLLGHPGEGPGDFRAVDVMPSHGDTVIVWDGILSRVTTMDTKGIVLRVTAVDRPALNRDAASGSFAGSWREMLGLFDDGRMLSRHIPTKFLTVNQQDPRKAAYDITFAAKTSQISTLSAATFFSYFGAGGISVSGDVPFGPMPSAVVGRNTWYYTNGASPEVEERNESGVLLRRMSLPIAPERVTDRDIAEYKRLFLSHLTERPVEKVRPTYAAMLDWITFPAFMPATDMLIVDEFGNIWSRQFRNDSTALHSWHVLAPNGAYLGKTSLRGTCRPTQVGTNFLLAVCVGDEGIETIEMYRVE